MKISLFIIAILFLITTSCKKGAIQYIDLVNIESYHMPDTILLGEIAPLHFTAMAENGCWSNLYVELEKDSEFEYFIKAFGTFNCYEGGCNCPFNIVQKDTIIDFYPEQRGMYVFNISKYFGNEKIVMDTIVVR